MTGETGEWEEAALEGGGKKGGSTVCIDTKVP